MAAGRGGAGRQRGAAPPGRRGDRPGPLRPRPGDRRAAMVGAPPRRSSAWPPTSRSPSSVPGADPPRGPRHGSAPSSTARWTPTSRGDYDVEYRCVRDDGTTRWVHARGRAIFEGRGATGGPSGSSAPCRTSRAQGGRGAVEGGQGGRRDRQPGQGPVPRRAEPRAADPAGAGGHGRRPAGDDRRPAAGGAGLPGDDPPQHRAGDPADRRPARPQPGHQRQAAARPPAVAPQRPGRPRHGHRRRRGAGQGA